MYVDYYYGYCCILQMLPVTVVAFRCRQIEKYTSVTVLLHPMILRSRLLQGEKMAELTNIPVVSFLFYDILSSM